MRLCDVLCVVTLWLFNSLKEWIIVCIFCLSHTYYYNINCRLIPLYAKIFMFSVNKTHNWRNWGLVRLKHSSMEKEMAPHSSTLAWKIPWTEEPSMLQSMGSQRVGHDWVTSLSLFTFLHWRRKWQPTPVFLPGESRGRGSLVGCRLWGRTESDTTKVT